MTQPLNRNLSRHSNRIFSSAANILATARTVFLLVCTSALVACGGSSTSPQLLSEDDLTSGLLQPVTSEAQFLAAISSGIEAESSEQRTEDVLTPSELPGTALEAPADASQSAEQSFTTTYTLEAEVDEYDMVKYDGEHLFVASSRRNLCCFAIPLLSPLPIELVEVDPAIAIEPIVDSALADASFAPEYEPTPGTVRVLATDTSNATASEVAKIILPKPAHVQGMYRFNDQLAVLSTENFYGYYGSAFRDIYAWYRQSVALDLYSVADLQAIDKPEYHIEIEGGLVESRRIGDTIYVISRHTPVHPLIRPYAIQTEDVQEGDASDQQPQVDEPYSASEVIPQLSLNGDKRDLFYPTDCFVTNEKHDKFDRQGYAVITSITAIPVGDPMAMKTLCYNESATGIYVAEKAIYLTDVRYTDRTQTVVHKFALTELAPEYRGSAIVPGYVWTSGQSDFRLNEYRGQLRMITSEFTGLTEDRLEHRLFILQESVGEKALELVAQLPNELREQPIGKPNEALYGVRFFGERAYLVTFRQIDPLYVLDLSVANDPKIAGELEVPGFSDFLHPVNDNLLLGLGQTANRDRRVKLELFDISIMSDPRSLDTLMIGEEGVNSWSEAQYNRHAFTYITRDSEQDRFAVPASTSGVDELGNWFTKISLQLFQIDNKNSPALASMLAVGEIEANPQPDVPGWWANDSRSVIDGDAVFFVTGDFVWSALWDTPSNQAGPQ